MVYPWGACTNEGGTLVLFSDPVSNLHASYWMFLQDARVQERETTLYCNVSSTSWVSVTDQPVRRTDNHKELILRDKAGTPLNTLHVFT